MMTKGLNMICVYYIIEVLKMNSRVEYAVSLLKEYEKKEKELKEFKDLVDILISTLNYHEFSEFIKEIKKAN